jgi:Arc/MetJ-type ribon-helix-helix transcriptional regulator
LPKRVVDVPTYIDKLARESIRSGLYDNFDHLVAIALQKQLKADEDKTQAWSPRERA